jgi:hypothetical protein
LIGPTAGCGCPEIWEGRIPAVLITVTTIATITMRVEVIMAVLTEADITGDSMGAATVEGIINFGF